MRWIVLFFLVQGSTLWAANSIFGDIRRVYVIEDLKSHARLLLTGTTHTDEAPTRIFQLDTLIAQSQRVYLEIRGSNGPNVSLYPDTLPQVRIARKILAILGKSFPKNTVADAFTVSVSGSPGTEDLIGLLISTKYPNRPMRALETLNSVHNDLADVIFQEHPRFSPAQWKAYEQKTNTLLASSGQRSIAIASARINSTPTPSLNGNDIIRWYIKWILFKRESRWLATLKSDLSRAAPKSQFLVAVGVGHIARLRQAFANNPQRYSIRSM